MRVCICVFVNLPQTIFEFQIVLYSLQNGWKWISATLVQLENVNGKKNIQHIRWVEKKSPKNERNIVTGESENEKKKKKERKEEKKMNATDQIYGSISRVGCGERVNEIHYRKSMSKEHIAADCQGKRTCISALRQQHEQNAPTSRK